MQHERVGQIIDIFRCTGEVKILFVSRQILVVIEFLFQEVLDGFDIMIGRTLDFFHSLSVTDREVSEDFVHEGLLCGDLLDLGRVLSNNLLIEQRLEPAQLYIHSEPHQREL